MANDILYDLTPWEDAPSTLTPINAENLNARDSLLKKVVDKTNQLSEQIGNQSGLANDLKTAFINYYTHVMSNFDDTNGLSYVNAILTALGAETRGESGGEEEPDTPDNPEVTLTSISATYEGGEVAVGTALTDLTGITVTAHYSDGTTANVTGYTLSGEIVEGSNTITVSYNGLTTTFTVTGIAEEEPDEPVTTLRGLALPDSPTTWSSTEDWLRGNNGSVIGNLVNGVTEGSGTGWAYITHPFTGNVYVRSLGSATKTNYSYSDYMIIADDETAIQNPSYDTLSSLQCSNVTSTFTIDSVANQQFVAKKDGTYEQVTGTYVKKGDVTDGYGVVVIQKFEIPEGKIGYLCCGKLHNDSTSDNSNSRWVEGVNAVLFENPYSNPTATVQEVTA